MGEGKYCKMVRIREKLGKSTFQKTVRETTEKKYEVGKKLKERKLREQQMSKNTTIGSMVKTVL